MIVEPHYNLKCHPGCKLLPKDVLAMTVFGHIFFNMSEEEFLKYMDTASGIATLHHEYLHTLQGESFKTKYLGFYIYYVYYWLKNIFREGMDSDMAYYKIPFEKEAYDREWQPEYRETHWRDYVG